MTVAELFEHFSCYFSEIYYFDKQNNIEDRFIEKCDITDSKNEEFVDLYGEQLVDDWSYDFNANTIQLEF